MSVAHLPVKKPDKDQQDEDEEQRTHSGANYHRSSVWSCKNSMNNMEIFSQKLGGRAEQSVKNPLYVLFLFSSVVVPGFFGWRPFKVKYLI